MSVGRSHELHPSGEPTDTCIVPVGGQRFEHLLHSAGTYDEGVTEVVDPELVHDRGATTERSLRQRIIHV